MAPKNGLSDSESEAEADARTLPSDAVLEQALRDEVATVFKSGNMEELTVKRVRLATEKKLGIEEGFFKTTGDWKTRSDQIIKDEVEIQDSSPQDTKTNTAKTSPSPPPQPKTAPPKRTKGVTAPKPRKRQKTQTPVSEVEDEEEDEISEPSDKESEEEVAKPKKRSTAPKKRTSKPPPAAESPDASDDAKEDEPVEPVEPAAEAAKDESESEMSVVLDEEPQPARKRQKSAETSSKKKPAPKAAKGKEEDLDPDQAEIKRLQGWLVKCGIRKMWWRELQPYETPKAKIKHLKDMLEDVGMKGRYSLEKARQIRDERELKADLEQIQQGAKQWGTGSGDEASDGPPRRRAAARGRQALAFLESEGEETD